ncbi:hypothetical protein M5K25_015785 [Dendrobium thyrsiflorum]|uniref:Uncharacterized protein n=1 Tax=Dendrobium thyrsiflorum TaxID=117978 RepID=A0ABD0UZ82_DENTH
MTSQKTLRRAAPFAIGKYDNAIYVCDLENEGDVGDIIGLDQSDAFGFEHFGEARPEDSTYVDRFDDANLGDL